mmetsp:Transcript_17951/g.20746  ORF Transcript_17951/g.20746 Transcript_17951/m.20746 type:complete len:263 (-) Transcript_17951:226-1014(-)
MSSLPPLLPRVDAILILDGEGNRLAGKYYGDFLTSTSSATPSSSDDPSTTTTTTTSNNAVVTVEDLRSSFEIQLQTKIQGIAARPDAAEVITVMNKTAVFCGGASLGTASGSPSSPGDVRVVHVGPTSESELLLAHLCEGMYEALSHLMGGQTDRNMVLDNLELVFLLIDEHCDGGIVLEVDSHKLASSVLLRDDNEDEMNAANGGAVDGAGAGMNGNAASMGGINMAAMGRSMQSGDITIAQAFRQARAQLIAGLSAPDGM